MKKVLKKVAIAAVFSLAVFASCEKEELTGTDKPVEVTMQDVVLTGTVRDTGGKPLSNVTVTTGSLNVVTEADGTFAFEQTGTVDRRAVIRFEKAGYFTITRSGVKADEMQIEVVMQPKGNSSSSLQASFNASDAKTLSVAGMKVEIPAESLVKPDGSAYSGTVNADMFYLNPNNNNFTELMPGGDLAAVRSNNSEAQLISYGMTDITLTDNSGNPLQLKSGATSELVFPIPAGMESNPPASIPLWYFDEERGIWVEEGVATLQGNVYTGTVSHFSWHNLDLPSERVTIKGTVTDCEKKPVSYVKVTVDQTAAVTNSKGEYSVFVPANTPVTVKVKSSDYSNYSPEVSHNVSGKQGGSVVTQDISLPCRTQEPGDDAVFTIDKASVTYIMDGQAAIFTFDNFGKRIRWDMNYGENDHTVIIFDDLTQSYTIGVSGMWVDMPYADVSAEMLFSSFFYRGDLYAIAPGFTTLANETVAGKSCSVVSFDNNGCTTKIGGWNGLIMLMEDCEGVVLAATNINLNVPSNAFSKTMNIF